MAEQQASSIHHKKEVHVHEDDHHGPKEGSRVVVVAVDGSHHSEFALDFYVTNLRRPTDYVVLITSPEMEDIIKTTWDGSVHNFDREHFHTKLASERQKIDEKLQFFKEHLLSRSVRGKVKAVASNHPGVAICKGAEDENADFIVVGCRGLGTIRRTFMGSVSDYVLHHSHIPVVVCRHKHSHSHEHHAKVGHSWNL